MKLTRAEVAQALVRARNCYDNGDMDDVMAHIIDLLDQMLPELVAEQEAVRRPPNLTLPQRGEELTVVLPRFVREVNAVAEWMHDTAETVAAVRPANRTDSQERERQESVPEWHLSECPNCTPEQPCKRMRALMGDRPGLRAGDSYA